MTLVQVAGGWAFRTAGDLAAHLKVEVPAPKKLSRAALETLAIIAYHQPVTRAEIENIRGVATSKGTLDTLMEAGWIKPGRRKQSPGRPLTWVSTRAFLDHFGLAGLDDLPGVEELKARRPARRPPGDRDPAGRPAGRGGRRRRRRRRAGAGLPARRSSGGLTREPDGRGGLHPTVGAPLFKPVPAGPGRPLIRMTARPWTPSR